MKKNSICLLFLSSLLLSACGNSTNNDSDEPIGPHFYEESPFADEEEEDDNEEEEDEEDFSYLFMLDEPKKEFVLVDPKIKEYSDLMNAQCVDDDFENEDKINDLHGDKVKVKSYLGNYDKSYPIELSFSVDDSIRDENFKIRCWPKGSRSHYKESRAVDDVASFDNLLRGTEYEWCVISSSGKKSGIGTFKTADYIRILSCGKLFNVRDFGGWTTLDGKKIKQGLLYRGGEINDHRLESGHDKNISGDDDPAKEIFVKDFGIRLQVDLRNEIEADYMTTCPMNTANLSPTSEYYVGYKRCEIDSYTIGLSTKMYQDNIKTFFDEYLTHIDEKPIYCNCYGGADRTGTICFLLGAILGMKYTDLVMDYEATTFSNSLKAHNITSAYSKYPEMIETIKSWSFYSETKSLKSIIEEYLTTVCGVSIDSINKIRDIMLESPKRD